MMSETQRTIPLAEVIEGAPCAELPLVPGEHVGRLERALLVLAYLIEQDGDAHVALYERVECELHDLRRKENAKDRARELLATYKRIGGTNTILSRNLRLSSSDGPLPYFGL
jgi:hypothetical protein